MALLPSGPRGMIRANLQSVRDPIGTAERWRREYGDPMCGPGIDGQPMLLTGNPEGIAALFGAPSETFETFGAEQLGALLGDASLLVLSGAKHTALRKLLLPPFHGQRMRLYGQQICDLTRQLTRDYKLGWRCVAQDLMHAISLQTIVQVVFGITAPERAAEAVQHIDRFRRAFHPARLLLPLMLPVLRREFGGLGPWAALQRATRGLHGFLSQEIARCRAAPAERTDILGLLLAARQEDGTALGEQQIAEQLTTLLQAGHSTTATVLTWALYTLSRHPEALSELRAELAPLGPEPAPEALARAPLLEAVCSETLRFCPVIAATARRLRRPFHLLGYELPAGMSVGASILWAHSNPAVYAQPDRFWPARFLGRTYSPFEFLPFGGGHRRCIGAAFAFYEMKLVLGTLLSRFHFELASPRPVRVVQADTLKPATPIQMFVRPLAIPVPEPGPR